MDHSALGLLPTRVLKLEGPGTISWGRYRKEGATTKRNKELGRMEVAEKHT